MLRACAPSQSAKSSAPQRQRSTRLRLHRRTTFTCNEADPANTDWQHDLAVSHEKVGDAQQAQGNQGEALTSYRESLAVADRLAKGEPANTAWQRDLAVSHEKMGQVLQAQGNVAEALRSYR